MKILVALLLVLLSVPARAQAPAADELIKAMTTEVIGVLKQDKGIQAGNSKRIADLVETKVLPHFDFTRMTQLAVAVNWRRSTPEQQKSLVQEFKTLLVRTYSSALSLYRDQEIEVKPLRAKPADTEVSVYSEVKQRGRQPVMLVYEMEKTSAGWKVYDVKVGGVSLITTYRDEFASQVREAGVDGLIKTLASKNRELDAKGKS
jgi:phospholipid transport system substrate-binding protein